ncbi:DUF4252 domain-containing protein [Cellulophaga sp. 20_2_10]|uniref:DUF4252 domain-containing protein n=1 Tax=Cellulophaga sp. 20_2_10 TaxID=2942476 RepID=UPI00201AA9A3|nr:DUF4252 domain-containing protein [Cellulophaga sp. 20_2_10]MCL5247381.1 DUF4252 domain-containing protein [Cellulophaga sp. 20_2_10]
MKKLLIIAVLTALPFTGFSQSIFDKFEDLDNVSSLIVNKSMFNLLTKIDVDVNDKENQEYIDIAKSISSLKVFITEDSKIGTDMLTTMKSYLKTASLEELMRVKDKEANIKFYIKSGKDEDHVSELLMFVSDIQNAKVDGRKVETVLVSITGDIDLNKIGSLTSKMGLPEQLKEVKK